MATIRFKKNAEYDVLHFHTGSLKINIFKVCFWGEGVTKKGTLYCVRF